MRNLLSRREIALSLPHARLNAVWYVDADHTYAFTRKRHPADDTLIAARTLTGSGEMQLWNGQTFRLPAGSLALLRLSDIARYAARPEGWQFYWFEFTTADSEPLHEPCLIPLSAQERIELERCFMSLSSGDLRECALAEAIFHYLMADWLLRVHRPHGAAPQELIALLEKGRQERLSIADMAHEAGMCERSFRSAVHRATGLSPKNYMLKGEMAAAMELLRTSSMTIAEIAACLGYASPFYFSRVFKKYYGFAPLTVREGTHL